MTASPLPSPSGLSSAGEGAKHPRLSALILGASKSVQGLCNTNTCVSTRLNPRGAAPGVSFFRVLQLEGGWTGAVAALP